MLQWFIRFPELTEFNESSNAFRKNSIDTHKQIDFSMCDVKSNVPGTSIIKLPLVWIYVAMVYQ